MRERAEQILKIVCAVLLALLAAQLVKASFRVNPLRGVTIPELPTLTEGTNDAPASATNVMASAGKGTNKVSMATNALASGGTNVVMKQGGGTNAAGLAQEGSTNHGGPLTPALSPSAGAREDVAVAASEKNAASNSPALAGTRTADTNSNSIAGNEIKTNLIAHVEAGSNATPVIVSTTNASSQSNSVASAAAPTNAPNAKPPHSNVPPQIAMRGGPPGIHGPPGMRGGGRAPDLEPDAKARVLKVYESELLGPIIRPQPMALMGIAGNTAFLRSPNGQTGLVKEGDSLGEIKLLRIGINRVLVEENGQKKELTIFQGYGGKSLLEKEDSNENARNKK